MLCVQTVFINCVYEDGKETTGEKLQIYAVKAWYVETKQTIQRQMKKFNGQILHQSEWNEIDNKEEFVNMNKVVVVDQRTIRALSERIPKWFAIPHIGEWGELGNDVYSENGDYPEALKTCDEKYYTKHPELLEQDDNGDGNSESSGIHD